MDHVILFRNTANGRVGYVTDDDGELAVFPDRDAAIEATKIVPILRSRGHPYQIIELDEL
jgi:hypothetical protein